MSTKEPTKEEKEKYNTADDPRNLDPKYPKPVDPVVRIAQEEIEEGIEFISLEDFLEGVDFG